MSLPADTQACDLFVPRMNAYITHEPTDRQIAGLLLPHREVLFGGAAGGGKSDWLLMGALQYVDVPKYAALLLRRTYSQLNRADSLIPRSHEWLANTKASWNGDKNRWTFPSGATVEFGHLQHEFDKYNYQSAAYQYIGFDELTQFRESQYRYLHSRLRRLVEMGWVPTRMRSASNPGGEGHEWVKARFMTERTDSRIFIPSRLADNPYLDQADYEAALDELDPVTRAQLLRGDWDVRDPGSLFDRDWFDIVDEPPDHARVVSGWDFAATVPKKGKARDPDWTVRSRVSRDKRDGRFYIEHVVRDRVPPASVRPLFVKTVRRDGRKCDTWIEQEPGASGKIVANDFIRAAAGYSVHAMPATGDKALRAKPFATQAKAGNVSLVRGEWNSAFLDELDAFGPECPHDDQVDATSLAFSKVARKKITWADLYPGEGEAA